MNGFGDIPTWILAAFLFLTACSAAYYLAVCVAAWSFLRDRARAHSRRRSSVVDGNDQDRRARKDTAEAELPPISILKPVSGADPDFYENIRSHALQDYPNFELLFGAGDAADPALEAVKRLAAEFPHLRIAAFVCNCSGPGNHKVLRLERLEREARFEFLLVNDSDIRVEPNYLREVVQPFLDSAVPPAADWPEAVPSATAAPTGETRLERGPRVGLVSCPYRARPGGTFASLLESLSISAEFESQVLLTRLVGQVDYALGATMLFRRGDLERIGGFRVLAPYLADDYELGNRIQALGRGLVISTHAVEIALGDDGWGEVWRRQVRWSRTIRACRPGGHFGLLFTQGSLWSFLALVTAVGLGAGSLVVAAPAAVLLLRVFTAWFVGWRCVGSLAVARRPFMIVLADGLSFASWLASFFTRRVYWRSRLLKIDRDGRIVDESPAENHGVRCTAG